MTANGQVQRVGGVKPKEREALQQAERTRLLAEIELHRARADRWKTQAMVLMEQIQEMQGAEQTAALKASVSKLDDLATKMADAHGIPQDAIIDPVTLEWHVPESAEAPAE